MALKQWHSRNDDKWHKYGLKLQQQQRKVQSQIQLKNTHSDMALISSLCETTGFQIQTTDIFNPTRGPLTYQALFEKLRLFLLGRNKHQTSQDSSRSWTYAQARVTLHTIGGGVRLVLVLFLHGWWNAFYVPKMCIPFFFLGMEGTTVKASLKEPLTSANCLCKIADTKLLIKHRSPVNDITALDPKSGKTTS